MDSTMQNIEQIPVITDNADLYFVHRASLIREGKVPKEIIIKVTNMEASAKERREGKAIKKDQRVHSAKDTPKK